MLNRSYVVRCHGSFSSPLSSPTVGILDAVYEPQSSDCDEIIGLGHHMATSRVDPCAFILYNHKSFVVRAEILTGRSSVLLIKTQHIDS